MGDLGCRKQKVMRCPQPGWGLSVQLWWRGRGQEGGWETGVSKSSGNARGLGGGVDIRPGAEGKGRCPLVHRAGVGDSCDWLAPPLGAHLSPPPTALATHVSLLACRHL